MDLQADSVQGVLFLTPGQPQVDALKLWDRLFPGDSPDGFQRASPSPSLESSAAGERKGHRVAVSTQVGRIDLTITKAGLNTPEKGPPRVSDVLGAAERMAGLLKAMAKGNGVVRIALVVELGKTVPRGSEGKELLQLLKGFPFPANAMDIVVQFNSRTTSKVEPLVEINRLCTFSSGHAGFVTNSPGVGSGVVLMTYYVGLKIDVNTAPETRFSGHNVDSIVDNLLSESRSIYQNGLTPLGVLVG
jgi:hypothetical protein